MSCERALNFDQWKIFSENYKPMRRLVYKFTENNCDLRISAGFIQTRKRYPASFDKMSILAWKLYLIKPKFSLWTKLQRNLLYAKYLISVAATLRSSNTFLQFCFLRLKRSTIETRKNVFYFTSKALFVLEIFKF